MLLRHASARSLIPWPTPAAVDLLLQHEWPGNVRELENVIQRALLFAAGDTIEAGHIVFDRPVTLSFAQSAPAVVQMPVPVVPIEFATLSKVVQMSEFQAIRDTLAACGGSRVETARRLGISERTLRYRPGGFGMSGVSGIGAGIGGGAMGIDRVMALRAQILDCNEALSRASQAGPAAPTKPASFADTMSDALKSVNDGQTEAAKLSESYERGETVDIAKVMLARQQASAGFEATLQVRNKILAACKDIMSMPV